MITLSFKCVFGWLPHDILFLEEYDSFIGRWMKMAFRNEIEEQVKEFYEDAPKGEKVVKTIPSEVKQNIEDTVKGMKEDYPGLSYEVDHDSQLVQIIIEK